VPDYSGPKNLSGDLGHLKAYKHPIKYIGPLSRLKKIKLESKYNLMVLLSGPEPQRSYLEEQLLEDLKHYKGNVLFVRGKIEPQQKHETKNNLLVYNFMTRKELEIGINESDLVLSRSGYTTLMDLAKLEKKAFFIPTPGQFEQEYLAKKLYMERVAPYAPQAQFNLKMLSKVEDYNGFKLQECDIDFNSLFRLF
jgi:hypothetical protein